MSSKHIMSIVAALALSLPAAAAFADPEAPTDSNLEIENGEQGVPWSVDFGNREVRPATNDQINSAETGNPENPDYRNRTTLGNDNLNAEWQTLESGNPDSVRQAGSGFAAGGDSSVSQ
jgi:hypothetical protein